MKNPFYTFRIIIEPDEPRGYHGFVPLLKGVHTCGKTIEEVKTNLREAIKCHIQGMLKDRESIPQEEESLEIIQTFPVKELSLAWLKQKMPKLPVLKSKELVKILSKLGFLKYHQVGSHAQFKRDRDGRKITIPVHAGKDITKKTLKGIIDDLDLTVDEFIKLRRK